MEIERIANERVGRRPRIEREPVKDQRAGNVVGHRRIRRRTESQLRIDGARRYAARPVGRVGPVAARGSGPGLGRGK